MKRTRLTSWLLYALATLLLVALLALGAAFLAGLGSAKASAILVAAALAYVLQLAAFGLLIAFRDQAQSFIMAWLSGMLLRLAALAVCAWWLSSTEGLPRAPLLLAYVAFVFLLVLLEPVFLRWDLRTR